MLIRKEKSEKTVNIDEIIVYLKSTYSTHKEEPRTFIHIPTKEPSFQAITNYLKTFSKSIKEDENIKLKKQVFIRRMDFNGVKSTQKRDFVI